MDYTIAFKLNCWSTIGRLLNQYGDHFTRALCRFLVCRLGRSPELWSEKVVRCPTMSMRIETSIENLIEVIEKRPALYKKQLKEYSDINLKKKLWEKVCEVVIPDWNELGAQEKTKQGKSNGMSAINQIHYQMKNNNLLIIL
ncbi:hypothetical protein QTP88_020849 [Uroleucon formosanum]